MANLKQRIVTPAAIITLDKTPEDPDEMLRIVVAELCKRVGSKGYALTFDQLNEIDSDLPVFLAALAEWDQILIVMQPCANQLLSEQGLPAGTWQQVLPLWMLLGMWGDAYTSVDTSPFHRLHNAIIHRDQGADLPRLLAECRIVNVRLSNVRIIRSGVNGDEDRDALEEEMQRIPADDAKKRRQRTHSMKEDPPKGWCGPVSGQLSQIEEIADRTRRQLVEESDVYWLQRRKGRDPEHFLYTASKTLHEAMMQREQAIKERRIRPTKAKQNGAARRKTK